MREFGRRDEKIGQEAVRQQKGRNYAVLPTWCDYGALQGDSLDRTLAFNNVTKLTQGNHLRYWTGRGIVGLLEKKIGPGQPARGAGENGGMGS